MTELTDEREQWRADLTVISRVLSDAGLQAQQLLDRGRPIRLVSTGSQAGQTTTAQPVEEQPAAAATGTDGECSWQF